MTKDWTFDQLLDDKIPTSSTEERARIVALFHQKKQQEFEEVDYVAAFEMKQQKAKENSVSQSKPQEKIKPGQVPSSTITSDYMQHLANVMAQNNEDIAQSQKKSRRVTSVD